MWVFVVSTWNSRLACSAVGTRSVSPCEHGAGFVDRVLLRRVARATVPVEKAARLFSSGYTLDQAVRTRRGFCRSHDAQTGRPSYGARSIGSSPRQRSAG